MSTPSTLTAQRSQRHAGKLVFDAPDGSGYKTRAQRLAEYVGGKWSHRERGYLMSERQFARLGKLFDEGCDASRPFFRLEVPESILARLATWEPAYHRAVAEHGPRAGKSIVKLALADFRNYDLLPPACFLPTPTNTQQSFIESASSVRAVTVYENRRGDVMITHKFCNGLARQVVTRLGKVSDLWAGTVDEREWRMIVEPRQFLMVS